VRGFNPSTLVAKNRLVGAFMTDTLPWGLKLSAKLTWDDGLPRRLTNCSTGFGNCVSTEGDAPSFTQVDVSLAKEFAILSQKLTLRADVLNLFDKTNYGGFDDWVGGPGNPQNYLGGDNANLGKPNSVRGDTRTIRLALGYKF
jgi:outer membrane receptor protein involved in Fe transport